MRRFSSRALARDQFGPVPSILIRQAFPILAFAAIIWVLRDKLPEIRFSEILITIREIPTLNWFGAGIATIISFAAIGRYDRIVHRLLKTGVSEKDASQSGIVAVALAQFAGFGLLSGTLARWRMLPDLSMASAAGVTAFVSGSFLMGWVVFAAFCDAFLGGGFLPLWADIVILLGGLTLLALPTISSFWPNGFPSSQAMLRILGAVIIDLGAAGAAFYLLLPSDATLSFAPFLTAFVFAIMAGLVCGTPGGIGALELTLIAHLPMVEDTQLLSAAIAFRLVYHAIPAVLASAALLIGPRPRTEQEKVHQARQASSSAPLPQHFAEAGLIHAKRFRPLSLHGSDLALVAEQPQAVVALAQPTRGANHALLAALDDWSQGALKSGLLYKATPTLAATARASGWSALRCGQEAILTPTTFTLDTPEHRQLRRYLRKAAKANVQVRPAKLTQDIEALTGLAKEWSALHGCERGFVMGTFCPDYIAHQRIWIAEANGKPVAFVTFHAAQAEWTLDLMRHGADTPDGTMHALIYAVICDAAKQKLPRLSLAAVPIAPPGIPSPIARRYEARAGTAGLLRFKSAFGPTWSPRYAVATSKTGLVLGLLDVLRAIHRHN